MEEEDAQKQLRILIRNERLALGLIDLGSVRRADAESNVIPSFADEIFDPEKQEDASKRNVYVGAQAGFFVNSLKHELERLIYAQEKLSLQASESHAQDLVIRGTLNGLLLVYRLYKEYMQEHIDSIQIEKEESKQ